MYGGGGGGGGETKGCSLRPAEVRRGQMHNCHGSLVDWIGVGVI